MGTARFRDSIRVRLSAGLYRQLDEVAQRDGRTHSDIVREALRIALGAILSSVRRSDDHEASAAALATEADHQAPAAFDASFLRRLRLRAVEPRNVRYVEARS